MKINEFIDIMKDFANKYPDSYVIFSHSRVVSVENFTDILHKIEFKDDHGKTVGDIKFIVQEREHHE